MLTTKLRSNTPRIWVCICLFLFLFTACTSSGSNLKIVETSISPAPIVGKVVTLHIEVKASEDKPDVLISVHLPNGFIHIAGELEWRGSLAANYVQEQDISFCVSQPGEKAIYISAIEILSDTSSWGDVENLYIRSTLDSAEVIPSSKYRSPNLSFMKL